MPRTFVLMTAMPPTKGHLDLIRFAYNLANGEDVTVLVSTQPDEPYPLERFSAIKWAMVRCGLIPWVDIHWYNKKIDQNPETEGFWDMWREIMSIHGFQAGDVIVASEFYGKRLAEECGGVFMPYDLDRSINSIKATTVREGLFEPDLRGNTPYKDMLPEFQSIFRARITIFGAESTGKTTLARDLGRPTRWLFEYARPYLENTTNEISVRSMTDIWNGQRALQKQVDWMDDVPYVIQDTDLFSTVGYWNFPHWQDDIGPCPQGLVEDALALQSDLYIVTRSNIPFEEDPLRYGGTVREGSDEYWIALLEQYNLPYVILEPSDLVERYKIAKTAIKDVLSRKAATLHYNREAN